MPQSFASSHPRGSLLQQWKRGEAVLVRACAVQQVVRAHVSTGMSITSVHAFCAGRIDIVRKSGAGHSAGGRVATAGASGARCDARPRPCLGQDWHLADNEQKLLNAQRSALEVCAAGGLVAVRAAVVSLGEARVVQRAWHRRSARASH